MTHTLKFWENLKKGTEAEEFIANLWKDWGWNVFNISSYHLPIDLLVWKEIDGSEFCIWIQVKMRTNPVHPLVIKKSDILWWVNCEEESGFPVILITWLPSENIIQIHQDPELNTGFWRDFQNMGDWILLPLGEREQNMVCEFCGGKIL